VNVRTHRVPLSDTPRSIEVHNPAGSVTVEAVEGAEELVVRIEPLDQAAAQLLDEVQLVVTDSRLRVTVPQRRLLRTPSFAIGVTTPPDAPVRVAVASADVDLRGTLGRAELTAASGDVSVERCAELEVRAASGHVRVGAVKGTATIGTASGDVRLGSAGRAVQLRTASGDVQVGEPGGDLSATTASGDVTIDVAARGTVRLRTVSGDATVGVVPGLRLWLDMRSVSGRLESDLDDDTDDAPEAGAAGTAAQLTVLLQSVSGDLRIRRAASAAPAAP
jgi:hypothetical protein